MSKFLKMFAGAIVGLTFLMGLAHADMSVQFKDLTLNLPFADTEIVYLYDLVNPRSLGGIETMIASWRGIEGSFGVVTDDQWNGIPFLGVRHIVPLNPWSDAFYAGVWFGRDFKNDEWAGGIKASILLWSK